MRNSWTDDRLDDFRSHVDVRFDPVEAELRAHRIETRAGFDRVDARFESMEARIDGQLDSIRHLILRGGGALFATLVAGILAVLGSHL